MKIFPREPTPELNKKIYAKLKARGYKRRDVYGNDIDPEEKPKKKKELKPFFDIR